MTPALTSILGHLERELAGLTAKEFPEAAGELERIKSSAWLRLVGEAKGEDPPPEKIDDGRWIEVGEAAQISGMSQRWFYDNWEGLPFARKLSRKALRFHEPRLRRWIESRKGLTL
jgi:predicted DNA-binding transcriptional regulator AlpA